MTAEGPVYRWHGIDRAGQGKTGRARMGSVSAFTEGLYASGWRRLSVYMEGCPDRVAAIERSVSTGRRQWWAAESGQLR